MTTKTRKVKQIISIVIFKKLKVKKKIIIFLTN